ncbi:DUF3667 domain-containing protein [Salibacteraceae bacterium]|jgi:hypothetical protein|nr:DUF3667 domain-containing protein [Salibacteraceae bacterium]
MSQPITTTNFINEAMCCNVCHRQIKKKRLTLKFLANDALKNIFNLERGLFYTIIELFKQPEVVIRDFLDGDRYRYMNPFRFLLVAASFYAIVVSVFGFSVEGIIEMEDGTPMDLDFVKEYSNLIILINVPLVALGSWLAFRPAKLNYAEHLVINAYAYSFMTIVSIPFGILFSAFLPSIDAYWEMISSTVLILVIFYIYIRALSKSVVKGILRTILTFIYVGLFSILIFTPIAIIIKRLTCSSS